MNLAYKTSQKYTKDDFEVLKINTYPQNALEIKNFVSLNVALILLGVIEYEERFYLPRTVEKQNSTKISINIHRKIFIIFICKEPKIKQQ